MRSLKKAFVGIFLMAALVGGSAVTADASPSTVAQTPSEICGMFPPDTDDYGVVTAAWYYGSEPNVVFCEWDFFISGRCFGNTVKWFGGWNGPYDVIRIPCS